MELMWQQHDWRDEATRVGGEVLARVFLWTGLGLGLSVLTAAVLGGSGVGVALASGGGETLVLLAPLLLLAVLAFSLKRLPLEAVQTLYILFAISSGGALSLVLSLAPPPTLAVALGPASIGFAGAGLAGLVAEREPGRVRLLGLVIGIGLVAAAILGVLGAGWLLPCVGVLGGAVIGSFDLLCSRRIDELAGDIEDPDRLAACGAVCLLLDLVAFCVWLAFLLLATVALTVSDG